MRKSDDFGGENLETALKKYVECTENGHRQIYFINQILLHISLHTFLKIKFATFKMIHTRVNQGNNKSVLKIIKKCPNYGSVMSAFPDYLGNTSPVI